ncbi:MAG: hypothetical protein ACPG8W_13705 [Candidatus Promineifilaceae bacterium]
MTTTFAPTHRDFVSYIDKSREFYLDKGFGNPYKWATNYDVPFASLDKPLSACRVGLVTTAALDEAGGKNRQVYAAPTDPVPTYLHTHHLSWHKTATHTRDVETFLPVQRVNEFVSAERIHSLSPRFYGVPTKFSQRQTSTEHAPMILDMCRADKVDVVLLVAL